MTTTPDDGPTRVGQQLAARRDELELTQGEVARRIGITVTSVSAAERGRSTIMRSKRRLWEEALRLKAGSISRAYAGEEALLPADAPREQPYADLSDYYERIIWSMKIPETERRTLIDIHRAGRASEQRGATG